MSDISIALKETNKFLTDNGFVFHSHGKTDPYEFWVYYNDNKIRTLLKVYHTDVITNIGELVTVVYNNGYETGFEVRRRYQPTC